LKQEDVAQI